MRLQREQRVNDGMAGFDTEVELEANRRRIRRIDLLIDNYEADVWTFVKEQARERTDNRPIPD